MGIKHRYQKLEKKRSGQVRPPSPPQPPDPGPPPRAEGRRIGGHVISRPAESPPWHPRHRPAGRRSRSSRRRNTTRTPASARSPTTSSGAPSCRDRRSLGHPRVPLDRPPPPLLPSVPFAGRHLSPHSAPHRCTAQYVVAPRPLPCPPTPCCVNPSGTHPHTNPLARTHTQTHTRTHSVTCTQPPALIRMSSDLPSVHQRASQVPPSPSPPPIGPPPYSPEPRSPPLRGRPPLPGEWSCVPRRGRAASQATYQRAGAAREAGGAARPPPPWRRPRPRCRPPRPPPSPPPPPSRQKDRGRGAAGLLFRSVTPRGA